MQRAISVTDVNNYIKQVFDAEQMLMGICVVGEISGFNVVRNIAYFSLKDKQSVISCVCFDESYFNFQNGDNVTVVGTVKFYSKGGKISFNINKITKQGQGELYEKFLKLKTELQESGYFNEDHKIPKPKEIKRIGVVTSKEGAVIQDILNVSKRRNPFVDIVLYSTKVQGEDAENQIAKAITFMDNYEKVDVIVVARGGGSFEDLQPFNTKEVADAIYNCKKFVMSAVGHETDYTICDMCCDMRAPTPSAAAELLCENVYLAHSQAKIYFRQIRLSVKGILFNKNSIQKGILQKIYTNELPKLISYRNTIAKLHFKINSVIDKALANKCNQIKLFAEKFEKLDPEKVLKLGYAKVMQGQKNINSIENIVVNDDAKVLLKDGYFDCVIKNVVKENRDV